MEEKFNEEDIWQNLVWKEAIFDNVSNVAWNCIGFTFILSQADQHGSLTAQAPTN